MSHSIDSRLVFNADLRNGHSGLAKLAQENRISIPNLKKNDFAFFANNDFSACKVFSAKDELLYYRPNTTMELDEVLRVIAKVTGQSFEHIKKKFKGRFKTAVYKNYEGLEQRHKNIEKRRAESSVKKPKKSTRASSRK